MTPCERIKKMVDLMQRALPCIRTDAIEHSSDNGEWYATEVLQALEAIADLFEEAPDPQWHKELYTLSGEPMFLTDEGWEPWDFMSSYTTDDPNFEPLDIVNPPADWKKAVQS